VAFERTDFIVMGIAALVLAVWCFVVAEVFI
jgi:hypothetical protein